MVCVTAIKAISSRMVYNEQSNVDEKCADVAEILPGKESASIRVRVVRMWKAPGFINPSETNSLEMVLIDAKVSSSFI
jgi:hypothetical protein